VSQEFDEMIAGNTLPPKGSVAAKEADLQLKTNHPDGR
jgi:hypothetical protein